MKLLVLGVLLGLSSWLLPVAQGPDRPAPPPANAGPLPPVQEPWRPEIDRSDLQQRFQADDPLMGIYELRGRGLGGLPMPNTGKGWLVIGRRHLLICLEGPGPDPDIPLFRAGVRRFTRQGNLLNTTVLAGHFNLDNGDVKIEPEGLQEQRLVEVVGGRLRVLQNEREWLEFARVE